MKKFKVLYTIGILSCLAIVTFVLGFIYLKKIETGMHSFVVGYGYTAILFITIIVDTLPQPIGPEISLILGKLMNLNPFLIALITIIGSTFASLVNYQIGRLFHPKSWKGDKNSKYIKFYRKYGKYALLVSALGPVPYVPFCWFSGTFRLSTRNFVFFGIIPRIIRIIFVSTLLFFLNISIIQELPFF